MQTTVNVTIEIKKPIKYPVYCFDMWMWFDSQSAYLDWQDSLRKT